MAQKSMKINVAMNAIRTVSAMIFPLATFPYVSRVLGPEGVGKTNFATAFVQYFILFASLGIPLYGIREVARVRDDDRKLSETVQELLLLHLVASVLALGVFHLVLPFNAKLGGEYALFSITSTSILLAALGMDWLYQGREEYTYITVRSIAFTAASVVCLFLFVKHRQDYVVSAVIGVAGTLGSSVLNFWNARRLVLRRRQSPWNLSRHAKPLLLVYAMNVIISLYVNLDTVMLGFLSSSRDVGYYANAMRLVKTVLAVATSMGAVLMPRLAWYLQSGRRDEFDRVVEKSFSIILLLCIPAAAGLMLLSREIMGVFAGREFLEAGRCMAIAAPIVVMIGITNILGIQILYPLGKDRLVVLSVSVGAVVSVALNLVLIPRFSHIGAAVAALVSETAVLAVQVALVRLHAPVRFPWRSAALYLLATAAMGAAVLGVRAIVASPPVRLAAGVPAGAMVYAAVVLAARDPFALEILSHLRRRSAHA